MTNPAGPFFGGRGCLRTALGYAWWRGHETVGTQHLLLSLVAGGDPISNEVFLAHGVTCAALDALFPEAARLADGFGGDVGAEDGLLEQAASGLVPWLPGRILATLLRWTPRGRPKSPRPRWTPSARGMVSQAMTVGGPNPCRADYAVSLLRQADSAAAATLADLGVRREDLLQAVTDAYGPAGPRPIGFFDTQYRPAQEILDSLVRSGQQLPGDRWSGSWRVGLVMATMQQIAAFDVATPREEHALAGLIGTYAALAADAAQFGPGWERCFPAGQALTDNGLQDQEVRQALQRLTGDAHFATVEDRDPFPARAATEDIFEAGGPEAVRLIPRKYRGYGERRTETLLLGILQRPNRIVDELLAEVGTDRDRVHRTLAELVTDSYE